MSRVVQAVWMGSKFALDRSAMDVILDTLRGGGSVVYPTDTLYGLGVDATREDLVWKVSEMKHRPAGQPMSVAVHGLREIEAWANVSEAARNFLKTNLPGAYTVILPPGPKAPRHLVSPRGIAFRMPRHPLPMLITRAFGPVTATSANQHGGDPPIDLATAQRQLGDAVDVYIDAGPCEFGQGSSVVDFTGERPKVIRPGPVPGRG